ncbi:MAG TPA: TonB-dependent receptor [Gemmatimonadales bacterium]|nr:TonB-dependent receptor [Gemmatimonadales bacterium]
MIRHLVRTVIYALAVCVPATSLVAQSGAIRGRVADSTGTPLANASIAVDGTSLRLNSGTQGDYEIRGVPAGRQTIKVRLIGYREASSSVTVVAGDVVRHDIALVRSAVQLAPIDVVVGSRARHSAAEELAVPVDVYTSEDIQEQGTTETSQVLAALSPSVNFPHQTVTDATDIVRPFTLRGLSPDHTLVLVNGWRRHQTALLNTFPLGSPAGSSGVDLNAIPASAIDRIEVLRDGASSQYGSDAIAGVVNIVMKEGQFSPFINTSGGRYFTGKGYDDDGTTVDVNGGTGLKLGRGSLGLFGQFMNREPTNRAFPDGTLLDLNSVNDSVDTSTGEIIQKRNGVPQPVNHLGDGLERDLLSFANLRMPLNESESTELYAFGGFSNREGTGNGYYRKPLDNRNWPVIYPNGFLPEFHPNVNDYSAAAGIRSTVSGWSVDFGGNYGRNTFDYRLRNTLNPSLGPCIVTACAPGADGLLGSPDDPNIPNQTSFDAGGLRRGEVLFGLNLAKPINLGLPEPVSVAFGGAYRHETYEIIAGETASWINGGHMAQDSALPDGGLAPAGSSVFSGFSPTDASNNSRDNVGGYLDLESNLTRQLLLNVAGRYEHYSDFGSRVTGKAAVRFQPNKELVFRAAASTGFRAPGLAQSWFSHVTTNFIAGSLVEIGNFPVSNRASQIFGAQPLKEETSVNYSGGVVFSPMENFTLTLDVFHISINDRILLGATYDAGDSVVARILADSGLTTIGGVQFPTNALDTRTNGIDLTGNIRLPTGSGTLDLNAGVNYTKNEIARVGGLPPILEGTGTSFTGALDLITTLAITEERPDWRGTLTANWSSGRFHALGRGSYYGTGTSAQFGGVVGETFSAKTLFDAEMGYRFNQINISIGAKNLFDVYPSRLNDLDNNNNFTFPWAVSSPFGYNGRFVYVRSELQLIR